MYSSVIDTPTIRGLFKGHLVSRRRIPIINCPTYKFIDALVSSFDMVN